MNQALTSSFVLLFSAGLSTCIDQEAFAQAPLDLTEQHAALERVVHFLDASEPDSALLIVDQLLGQLGPNADPEVHYYLRSFRSEQLYYHGLFDEAMSESMAAENLAHKLQDSLLVANSLNIQGLIHENIGDHQGALPFLRAALQWYPASATARYSVTRPHQLHGNLGQSLAAVGQHDSARHHLERSLELAIEAGIPRGIAIAHWALGRLFHQTGERELALRSLERSMEFARESAQSDIMLENHIALAEVHFTAGQRHNALAELERGRALKRNHAITAISRRDFHKRTAKLLRQMGMPEKALEHGTIAHEVDSAINARNRQAIIHTMRNLLDRENELEVQRLEASLYAEALERTRFSRLVVAVGSAMAILVVLGLYLGYRSRQRNLRRLAELELMRAQQEATIAELRIRDQVGRDMHDDLGAGLSGLKMRAELALRNEQEPHKRQQLSQLAAMAGELMGNMRRIIWTMDGGQGSLEDLVAYCTNYARQYLSEHGIQCTVRTPANWPTVAVGSELRRNVFLVIKEALHNVVKHAGAKAVELELLWENDALLLTVQDDGSGMTSTPAPQPPKAGSGRGLRNMRQRMVELGGSLDFGTGEAGTGMRISGHVPVASGAARA
jgi:signal transduction histidine kinase